MNIAGILQNHARRRPDHPAIIAPDREVTYREFHELVLRTASNLLRLGVGPHDVVGVCLKDTIDHIAVLFAIARIEAVAFPMDWRWTLPEKQNLVEFFGPKLVLVEPGHSIPAVETAEVGEGWHSALATTSPDLPNPKDADPPLVLALSSGTTGTPKGPLLSHGQMFSRFLIYFITLGFNEADRYLCATPLYFGGTRGYAMCTLYAGGTVVLFPLPYDTSALVEAVHRHRATRLFLVPTLLRRLLQSTPFGEPALNSLTMLFSSGAALHPEERIAVMERLCPRYVNFYGSTDGGGATALRPEDPGDLSHSVGRPVFGAWVEIVDDGHHPVTPNEVGRIRYRNAGTVTSYYNNPAASAQAFYDGWYYPGDLGWIDGRGYLFIAGRETDMIIRAGINIYPAEIEAVLQSHPAVAEAAVVGSPSREYGEQVIAFVVCTQPVDAEKLREHCRKALASYKVPEKFYFLSELPRSGVGKVIKSTLVHRITDGTG